MLVKRKSDDDIAGFRNFVDKKENNMKTITKKTIALYSKIVSGKWYRRTFLTALTAFALVYLVGTAANIVRDFVTYHTWGCLAATFIGVNVMLSRQKLSRIWRKLSILGEDAAPAPAPRSVSDVAAEFAAAVNTDGGEESFED